MQGISFIKVHPLTNLKAKLIREIREAFEEIKLIRSGKKEMRDA